MEICPSFGGKFRSITGFLNSFIIFSASFSDGIGFAEFYRGESIFSGIKTGKVMKILVATDGSDFSLAAARKCCDMIALEKDTSVKVFNVIETLTPAEPFGMTGEYYAVVQKAVRGVAAEIVETTRQVMYQTLGDTEADIETKTVMGFPKKTIVEEAEDWEADLIVVGSHGRGFWGRVFLGSVSDAVVRHAPCSVLVVRKDEIQAEKGFSIK